jgi:hypothetical protein
MSNDQAPPTCHAPIGLAFVSAEVSLLVYALVAVFYLSPWLPEGS